MIKQYQKKWMLIVVLTAIYMINSCSLFAVSEENISFFNTMGEGPLTITTILWIVAIVILCIIASFVYERIGFHGGNGKLRNHTKEIVAILEKKDSTFSKEEWLSFASSIFCRYLMNYAKENLFDTEEHITKEVLAKQFDQINANMIKDRAEVMDHIVVRFLEMASYEEIEGKEMIQVDIKAFLRIYFVCKSSHKLVEGSKEKVHVRKYTLTFQRKNSVAGLPKEEWVLSDVQAL